MTIHPTNITPEDVQYLDSLLLNPDTGRICLRNANAYANLDPDHLRVWAILNARYTFPTIELIGWLRDTINGRSAIEIGAGNGDLGFHLGIAMTDNYCQQIPEVKTYYRLLGQAPTSPRSDVEKIEAIDAVHKYKPQVVVGSYITEQYQGGDHGNMYGPDEEEIARNVDCYIHLGNERTHGKKRALARPHMTVYTPYLITRALEPKRNVIYVWGE